MTGFGRFLLRDAILLALTLGAWVSASWITFTDGWMADTVAVALGALAGMCAWQAHEWGHLVFARVTGGRVHLPDGLFSVYLFGFRNAENSKFQFIAMALGGFIATAIVFLLLIPLLPQDWLATRVFRSLVIIEILVTTALEVPGLVWGMISYKTLPSVNVLAEDTPAQSELS